MATSSVTIVVVPREQFSKAEASLESIYATTPPPFDLVYVDGNSPPALRDFLAAQAAARGFTLLRAERYLTSNEARNLALPHVRTPYVAFVDNDVFVTPGWLDALLRCAEETGAWAVGPLYCYGTDGSSGEPWLIHTAGADLKIIEEGGRRLHEEHRHVLRPVAEVLPQLHREPIDLVEFHCMLVRREAFDRTGPLDERLLSFMDHMDFCMAVRRAGGAVYFEPEAVVTHLAPPPFAGIDIPYFLLRWSDAWLHESARYFAAKHGLRPDADLEGHVWFRNGHRRRLVGGLRRRIRALFGKRVLKLADKFVDRVVFGLLIEHTVVARMQRRRRSGARREPRPPSTIVAEATS
ncbi:MAG TPA: glycosyltransferase family 2 protein [Gemmatimonadales bacterium]|jgi:GT2 family glycosyltransferase|nr:glycosyltransferase family 2 protein [Gemmatimonadales bacterium]